MLPSLLIDTERERWFSPLTCTSHFDKAEDCNGFRISFTRNPVQSREREVISPE
jgi:hypothetical protein